MDGFSTEVLRRLSLADAVLPVLSFVCEESFLEQVFEKYRVRSYQKVARFPTFARLIGDALLEHEGSGRQAMIDLLPK